MKKILITLMMLLSLGTAALAGDPHTQLRNLVSEYKGNQGFDVVDFGGLGLGLLKAAAKTAAETPEDREALKLFDGLKRLTIVDFEEAAPEVKEKFLRKANRILNTGEMLLEAKDDGETVRVYGSSSKDRKTLQDIALLADDALIFIRGSIKTDPSEALIGQAEND